MRAWRQVFRRARRPFGRAVAALVGGASTVISNLPPRTSLGLFDAMAWLLYWVDGRGRRAGRQNLRLVFGETLPAAERRRLPEFNYGDFRPESQFQGNGSGRSNGGKNNRGNGGRQQNGNRRGGGNKKRSGHYGSRPAN